MFLKMEENVNKLESKPKRLEYIDVAKFVAIFLVILCHAIGGDGEIRHIGYSFHLPIFFILNGITLRIKEDEPFGMYLQRKMKSYLIPIFCLGILCIFAEMMMASIRGTPYEINYIGNMIINLIEQKRVFPLWFVGSLFFADVFFYAVYKASKNKLPLLCFFSLLFLGGGIFFNKYFNWTYVWNIDVSLFGVFFIFIGYTFSHKSLTKVRKFVLSKRWISLLIGIGLFLIGLLISEYNYHTYNLHLEMWARQYEKYYLTIPAAILSSIGVILMCNGIRNKVMAEFGKATLILLPFHQIVTIPLFNDYIAHDWFVSLTPVAWSNDYQWAFYSLTSAVFSTGVLLLFYYFIIYSPFAFIINRKIPLYYKNLYSLVKTKVLNLKNKIFHKEDENKV